MKYDRPLSPPHGELNMGQMERRLAAGCDDLYEKLSQSFSDGEWTNVMRIAEEYLHALGGLTVVRGGHFDVTDVYRMRIISLVQLRRAADATRLLQNLEDGLWQAFSVDEAALKACLKVATGENTEPVPDVASHGRVTRFRSIPEIVTAIQELLPDATVKKTDGEDLAILVQQGQNRLLIPIRDAQQSGYFLVELPSPGLFSAGDSVE